MQKTFDVAIIGAGPIGLYAAFLGAERKLNVVVVDAQPEVGGQLTSLYPQKYIFDVAGYPAVTASGLVAALKRQVDQHEVPIQLGFRVAVMSALPRGEYRIEAEDGRQVVARNVIIAAGAGLISPRKLELEEVDRFLGKGFEYVVQRTDDYRDRRVLVIGGGDTALDWAAYFTGIAREVTLVHRSARFAGFEGSLQALQQTPCTILTDTKVSAIRGRDHVESVELVNTRENWTKEMPVDRILGCIGFIPKLGFLKEIGLEILESSVRADRSMLTNLPNVYAVGDISHHPGRIKLISTGFGNVQIAINHIVTIERESAGDVAERDLEQRYTRPK